MHGFFACMGGFLLFDNLNHTPRATLSPEELLHFVRDGSVDMPDIPKADLEDRSKGDILSKCIAILQLVWFFIQLVARYVQGLPITLLEIDTLAVAVLTCIAYGWWWKKPKDIARPHLVHWKATTSPPSVFHYEYVVNDIFFIIIDLCILAKQTQPEAISVTYSIPFTVSWVGVSFLLVLFIHAGFRL